MVVVTCSEANLFPDYLLPALSNLSMHESVLVRRSLAENLAALADTALSFLELSQLDRQRHGESSTPPASGEAGDNASSLIENQVLYSRTIRV